jgi:phage terminase large subunit-like protein
VELKPLPVSPWKPRNQAEKAAADRGVEFFRRYLRHTKGKWARQPFDVLPWEEHQVIRPLFGRLRADGLRQYRRAWIEVGKKSGKSEIAAGLGLKGLFADDEPMAEVYVGATDRDQAGIIFGVAAAMVRASPALRKRCTILESTKRIIINDGPFAGSKFEALAAGADSADGLSPSMLLFDEVHRYADRDFYDTLIRSTAARSQPIVASFTTAGIDMESLAWKEHEYARQVAAGLIDDPEQLVVIYAAPPGGDIQSPKYWQAANPSIGHTVAVSYFEQESRKAVEDPSNENSFRRFHGNEWVAQFERWMPMNRWDASAGVVSAELLQNVACWGGLDLSQTRDLTAFVIVGAPESERGPFRAIARFWIPEENVAAAERRDGVPYQRWIDEGWIKTTPGETVDYATVERDVRADSMRFPLQESAFDPTFAWQMAQGLVGAGLEMVAMRQGFETMAGPTADLLQLVKERRFEHGGNPVLRWMADNTVVEQDSLGRWRPSKRKAKKRIDGIVAAIMALDRAERAIYGPPEPTVETVIYDDPVQISPRI